MQRKRIKYKHRYHGQWRPSGLLASLFLVWYSSRYIYYIIVLRGINDSGAYVLTFSRHEGADSAHFQV